jgi:hypothetical protein
MRKILHIPITNIVPSINAVLEGQGVPRYVKPDQRMSRLAEEAMSLYQDKSIPIGVLNEISASEFEIIFKGEVRNEDETPVKSIYRASENLVIFAVTIGEEICREISRLFRLNEFALGSMLDSSASEGTEMAAQAIEDFFLQHLKETSRFNSHSGILRFSPGYCGWHISAQKKLFEVLKPEDIGITLNDSFLMQPLKSISGVIISGPKEIFNFDDTFSFCRDCVARTCRERIRAMMKK